MNYLHHNQPYCISTNSTIVIITKNTGYSNCLIYKYTVA